MLLGRKIAISGFVAVLVASTAVGGAAVWQASSFSDSARIAVASAADRDLDHITKGARDLVQAQNDAVQLKVDGDLKVAHDVLARSGPPSFGPSQRWAATDQISKQVRSVSLPRMRFGSTELGQNSSPRTATPIVDRVKTLVGGAATVFQRMNARGDMLRVATNVITTKGERAIGTFIPATTAAGTPNPVIAALLAGKTYRGSAFVVDAWYVAAYEPITNGKGEVVGALFVGQRQESVQSLRKALTETRVGERGFVTVLAGTGDDAGQWVMSHSGDRDGQAGEQERDAAGRPYVADILAAAQKLTADQVTTVHYLITTDQGVEPATARITYYAPWDWVIVANALDQDFTAGLNAELATEQRRMFVAIGIAALIIAALGALGARAFASRITAGLGRVTRALHSLAARDVTTQLEVTGTDEISVMTGALNEAATGMRAAVTSMSSSTVVLQQASRDLTDVSSQVGAGADLTATQSREAAAGTAELAGTVSAVATAAERMTSAIAEIGRSTDEAAAVATHAVTTAVATNQCVSALGDSSAQIGEVVKVITGIAEQTNLLALNATIEAARAGESGKGFAVVATEVKELAHQTAQATENIEQQIGALQTDSLAAVTAITEIVGVITRISDHLASIAAAVQEQTATTRELNEQVGQAAGLGRSIAGSLETVAATTDEARQAARTASETAGTLAEAASGLRSTVDSFTLTSD